MPRALDLSRRAAAAATRRVRAAARADGAHGSGLSALISVHALHAAGDALVAVALAGTLFFDVPLGEARTSVALYLLLTLLPFTMLVPVAGPILDRFPHGRRTVLALTTGGRALLTWLMAGATASLGLYPLALAVLILSRAYGVARSAAVPRVRPPAVGLVSANARLNVAAVAAAAAAAAVGSAMVAVLGTSSWALRLAALLLLTAAALALRLPSHVDEPAHGRSQQAPPARRFRLRDMPPQVTGPLATAVAMRGLAGLLTVFLAFLFRAESAPGLLVGSAIAAAAVGQLVGTVVAARLPARASRLLAVIALVPPFVAAVLAALMPTGFWVVTAVGATGMCVSVSKFALDAAVQARVPVGSISNAFARSETGLQLAWVVGAAAGLALPASTNLGFAVAAALPVLGLLLARQLALRGGGTG